jgi:hypothetical protein
MTKRPYYDPRVAPSEEAIDCLVTLRLAHNNGSVSDPVPFELASQLTQFRLAEYATDRVETRAERERLASNGMRTIDLSITESGLSYLKGLSR